MSYGRIGIPKIKIGLVQPFKIDILKEGSRPDGTPNLFLAVNYHSALFTGMNFTNQGGAFLQWSKLSIKNLDKVQEVPKTFPGENFYCVLKVTVNNLQASQAEIVWVSNDKNVKELEPIVFESSQNRRQTEARVIIGILVNDDEAVAGTPAEGQINTSYIIQYINTNLIMCSMVFDGTPVIYPVPFAGGRLNF